MNKPGSKRISSSAKSYGDFELEVRLASFAGRQTGREVQDSEGGFRQQLRRNRKGPGAFEGLLGREMSNPKSNRKTMAPDSTGFVYTIAFEFQLIDDERHKDALKDAAHQTGALYSMIPANTKAAKPAGEWNSSLLRQAEGPAISNIGSTGRKCWKDR